MTCAECTNESLAGDYLCLTHRTQTLSRGNRMKAKALSWFSMPKSPTLSAVRTDIREEIKQPLARVFFYSFVFWVLAALAASLAAIWLTPWWRFLATGVLSAILAVGSFLAFDDLED